MTVSLERLMELSANVRSIRSKPMPGDENRKWSALIYILVHHPKCNGFNEVVSFDTQQIDKRKLKSSWLEKIGTLMNGIFSNWLCIFTTSSLILIFHG